MTNLISVFNAATALFESHSAMQDFTDWPEAAPATNKPALPVPAADLVANFAIAGNDQTQPLINAIMASTQLAHWVRTYTEEEVGAHFLANYGYYELIGPKGHFQSDSMRAYVAYWGPGLNYDWHRHEAEEMYLCLAGGASFHAEGRDPIAVSAGDTVPHASNQPHAMITSDQPILALILWRGAGLTGLPTMDAS